MRRLIVPGLVLALLAGGCGEKLDHRTGPETLSRAMSRAFKRSYAAAVRMNSGYVRHRAVRHADVRCYPVEPEPGDAGEPWHWFCRVLYYQRDSARGQLATYGLRVDKLGCFQARTGAFPEHLYERVLNRQALDPLFYIRSCP